MSDDAEKAAAQSRKLRKQAVEVMQGTTDEEITTAGRVVDEHTEAGVNSSGLTSQQTTPAIEVNGPLSEPLGPAEAPKTSNVGQLFRFSRRVPNRRR